MSDGSVSVKPPGVSTGWQETSGGGVLESEWWPSEEGL